MDTVPCRATVHGVARAGYDLATKPLPMKMNGNISPQVTDHLECYALTSGDL